MSIVRWGNDSHLYIYEDANSDEIVCCGCRFSTDIEDDRFVNWTCQTYESMIEHVQAHILHGHAVPDYVVPELGVRATGVPNVRAQGEV